MALRARERLFQDRGSRIEVRPLSEPVSNGDVLGYLELPTSGADAEMISRMISTARQHIEDMLGLAFITQTWIVALDRWPTGIEPWWDGVRQGAISDLHGKAQSYELPRYPLISVDTVNVYDQNGTATSVNIADTFDIDTYRMPGRMTLRNNATWPIALRNSNAIEITYKAGYGGADDVPFPLRQAVIQFAAYLFEHRGGCDLTEGFTKSGAAALAGQYGATRL